MMELLGDVGLVESRFGPFVDSVTLDIRKLHVLHRMYQNIRNRFGRTRWNS
jgi:hypothetical protein